MASVSSSLVSTTIPRAQFPPGTKLKPMDQSGSTNLSFAHNRSIKCTPRRLVVQAAHSDSGGSGSSGAFVGGFVLGGLIVGALGCIYAPQISQALAGTDGKDLMKKLPKFINIFDEEKALEKTRKVLDDKIAQLNSAIDDISSQLRSEDTPNKGLAAASGNSDVVEAAI